MFICKILNVVMIYSYVFLQIVFVNLSFLLFCFMPFFSLLYSIVYKYTKKFTSKQFLQQIAYGSTETSPVVCMTDESQNYEDRISSNGLSCPHTEVSKIIKNINLIFNLFLLNFIIRSMHFIVYQIVNTTRIQYNEVIASQLLFINCS